MCGITGFWQKKAFFDENKGQMELNKMLQPIISRGPDDYGTWNDSEVFLGHRRLSIIDLSAGGHQPMVDRNSGRVIVFNGEIYNYRELKEKLILQYHATFSNNSDTEVILKAYDIWGPDCLKFFNGMFAFAIWDNHKKELFLARDRVGVKPLYIQNNSDIVIFASRPECIFQHALGSKEIDLSARELYFEIGYIPAPFGIWKNVKKLLPGHWMLIKKETMIDKAYWKISDFEIETSWQKRSIDDVSDELEELLVDAISLRNIADVPIGAFLSGGIDSSVICSIMQKIRSNPISAFVVGFEDVHRDESRYAQKIAKVIGCKLQCFIMNSRKLLEILPDYYANFDEPFADYSGLPTMLICREFRRHVTVALGGDGGDELFQGYGFYRKLKSIRVLFQLPLCLCRLLGRMCILSCLPKLRQLGNILYDGDLMAAYCCIRSIRQDVGTYLHMKTIWNSFLDTLPRLQCDEIFSRMDMNSYMIDDVLQKVDVASMAYSLEVRAPLLDYRILEFALKLPNKFKQNSQNGKIILKNILRRYIPADLFMRPKSGFTPPMEHWLRNELQFELNDVIHRKGIEDLCGLDSKSLITINKKLQAGDSQYVQFLWGILAYSKWADLHKTELF